MVNEGCAVIVKGSAGILAAVSMVAGLSLTADDAVGAPNERSSGDISPPSSIRYVPLPPQMSNMAGAYPEIYVDGEIDDTSLEKLMAIVADNKLDEAKVLFNSPGGDLVAGIEVGYYLREMEFITELGTFNRKWGASTAGECHSACTLAFIGGKYRFADENSRFGVHRFHTEEGARQADAAATEQEAQAISGLLVGYIRQMGVDLTLFEKMADQSSDDVELLDVDEMLRMNVINNGANVPEWELMLQDNDVFLLGSQERIDNMGTVAVVCGEPIDLYFSTAIDDELAKVAHPTNLRWVLDEQEFEVASQMVAESLTVENSELYVGVRLTAGQVIKLLGADAVGLSLKVGGDSYGYFVDLGVGADRKAISQFVGFCSKD